MPLVTKQSSQQFKFSGKVFCKESREGLVDLTVSLFDVDSAALEPAKKAIKGSSAGSADISRVTGVDRLGSSTTKTDGSFNIAYDAFEFAENNEETKPELLVIVQAPATPDSNGTGFGAILYWGMLLQPYSPVGIDAARSEALTIALPRDILEKHFIPVTGSSEPTVKSPQTQKRLAELYINRGLSSFTRRQRESIYYCRPIQDDISDLVTKRDTKETLGITSNLINRGYRLKLNESLKTRAGEDANVNSDEVIKTFRNAVGDGDLRESDDPAAVCRSRQIQHKSISALSDGNVESAINLARQETEQTFPGLDSHAQPVPSLMEVAEDLQGDLKDWVKAQLGTAGTPETALEYGTFQKGQNPEAVMSLRLKSGPADIRAFHDFEHLQIAYRHIWAEAFSEDYAETIEREFDEEVDAEADVTPRIVDNVEKYSVKLFAPGSVNFGLILTYRQSWESLDYQAGQLIKTITLTPGETREYSVVNKKEVSRSEKRSEDNQNTLTREKNSSASTIREAVDKAQNKTSFEAGATGSVSVGVFSGSASTKVGMNAEQESAATKRSIHDRTKKALQEEVNKLNKEIQLSDSSSIEQNETRKLSNSNDEMAITYLFYELQRRFRVNERLNRLQPVIFVANPVPAPDQINESWLRNNAWILKRVLLDDEFLEPLEMAIEGLHPEWQAVMNWEQTVAARKAALEEINQEIADQKRIAAEAWDKLSDIADGTFSFNDTNIDVGKDVVRAIAFGPFGGFGRRRRRKMREKRLASIQENLELEREEAQAELEELESDYSDEEKALESAVLAKQEADLAYNRKSLQVSRIISHVRQSIIYYMQAIWAMENADQRMLRLQNLEVNWLKDPEDIALTSDSDGNVILPIPPEDSLFLDEKPRLVEVANIDRLLGFFGNYMIFPVREPNYLHLFMMQQYVDLDTNKLKDPDAFSNWTLIEIIEYLACVQEFSEQRYIEELARLTPVLEDKKKSGRTDDNILIVPTDSVFVQAMPDKANPVMEDFKLAHRALDVKKVQAEVRQMEIDNIRRGARIMNDDLSAPEDGADIERSFVVNRDV